MEGFYQCPECIHPTAMPRHDVASVVGGRSHPAKYIVVPVVNIIF